MKRPENLWALHQNGVILFIDRPVDALAVGGGALEAILHLTGALR